MLTDIHTEIHTGTGENSIVVVSYIGPHINMYFYSLFLGLI